MVTRTNAINRINSALDRKLTNLISTKVNNTGYITEDINLEDIITVLIIRLANSPRMEEIEESIATNEEMKGEAIDEQIEEIIDYFTQDQQFIENVEAINQQRNDLLERANLLSDEHPSLERIVKQAENYDNYQLDDDSTGIPIVITRTPGIGARHVNDLTLTNIENDTDSFYNEYKKADNYLKSESKYSGKGLPFLGADSKAFYKENDFKDYKDFGDT